MTTYGFKNLITCGVRYQYTENIQIAFEKMVDTWPNTPIKLVYVRKSWR